VQIVPTPYRRSRLAAAVACAGLAIASPTATAAATAKPRLIADVYLTAPTGTSLPKQRFSARQPTLFGVVRFGRAPKAGRPLVFSFVTPAGKVVARWTTTTRTTDQIVWAELRRPFFRVHPGSWRLVVKVDGTVRRVGFRVRR